jgi:membrane protein DedA with SNARE-associated domain
MGILEFLIGLFTAYGYWVVFFGVMLENAGLPIPGETIVLAAGFFAADGHFQLPLVMLIAAVGAVIGDNIGFAVGRHFGRGILYRFGKYIFLPPHRIDRMSVFFESHGDKTILVARFITGLRVVGAILAGASKMTWPRFFLFNFLGAVLWAAVISTLGYAFGHSWHLLERFVGGSGLFLLIAVVIVGGLLWFFGKRKAEKKFIEKELEDESEPV